MYRSHIRIFICQHDNIYIEKNPRVSGDQLIAALIGLVLNSQPNWKFCFVDLFSIFFFFIYSFILTEIVNNHPFLYELRGVTSWRNG